MKPLIEDLQSPKVDLESFAELTKRVLDYLPNVVSEKIQSRGYLISSSSAAGTTKYARPIRENLYIFTSNKFTQQFQEYKDILKKLKSGDHTKIQNDTIDKVTYTIQQSIGIGLDFLSSPNSARKHVGNRFEELIRLIFSELDIQNQNITLKIPYGTIESEETFSCETDMVLSPFRKLKSTSSKIHQKEVVVSLKTSSKDRMGKIFLDKMLMQNFANKPIKVVGIFLNDVQRKAEANISYTFVSGSFMAYTKFLTQLDGVYFIDPPPITKDLPYNRYIFPFSKLIVKDIWKMLSS